MHQGSQFDSWHQLAAGRLFRRPLGFTVPELLAVVAIIAIVVSMLLPAMRRAKESAIVAQCLSDKRQIAVALRSYALDFRSALPTRDPATSYGYPHQMRRTTNGKYDLNKPFIIPYLGNRSFLFCPGLSDSPLTSTEDWASTQYHVFPKNVFWLVPLPNLTKINMIKGRAPLWSCFARVKGGLYTSHGHENIARVPKGMVSAYSDGGAEWVDWNKTEGYWQSGEIHYWPVYRE